MVKTRCTNGYINFGVFDKFKRARVCVCIIREYGEFSDFCPFFFHVYFFL